MSSKFEQNNPILEQSVSLVDIWQNFMYITEGERLLSNWHIKYIFEHLRNIINKKSKNLILNVPPGHSKTTIMMAFAAIYLGFYTRKRILILSGTKNVRIKYARGIRAIIKSALFKRLFNNTVEIDDNDINRLENFFIKRKIDKKGEIIGGGQINIMSTDARITGTDADLIIVDDPIDYRLYLVEGGSYIQKINENINGLFSRRREVMETKEVPFIVIMQRICEGDTTEFLLNSRKSGKWIHIKIPIVEEEKNPITRSVKTGEYGYGKIYKVNDFLYARKYGEILFEKIKNAESIEEEKEAYLYNGKEGDFFWQYHQRGCKKSSSVFDINGIQYYDKKEFPMESFDKIVHSWDTGFGKSKNGDPSCCTSWGIKLVENERTKRKGFTAYLIDVWFTHDDYPSLLKKALSLIDLDAPNHILIEDQASGQSLIQDLEKEYYGAVLDSKDHRKNKRIIAIKTSSRSGNKEDRAKACSHIIDKGCVVFPKDYRKVVSLYGKVLNSLEELKYQLKVFPSTSKRCHDDGVDSTTQFLNWAKTKFIKKKRKFKIWSL